MAQFAQFLLISTLIQIFQVTYQFFRKVGLGLIVFLFYLLGVLQPGTYEALIRFAPANRFLEKNSEGIVSGAAIKIFRSSEVAANLLFFSGMDPVFPGNYDFFAVNISTSTEMYEIKVN